MNIICIGNSIVNGFPHEQSKSFSGILDNCTQWNVINKGINGQSTDQILARFDSDVIANNPHKVLILTAANDFVFNINTPRVAFENIVQMIIKAKNSDIEPVILTPLLTNPEQASKLWMPDMNVDYYSVNTNLGTLSSLLKKYCKENNILLIDTQKEYLSFNQFVDGLHPTEKGQSFLADLVRSKL